MNCATRPRGSISDGFFAGARVCEVAIRRQAGLRGSGGGAGLLPTTRRALLPAIAVIFVPLSRAAWVDLLLAFPRTGAYALGKLS
jgi:hypothetical protein